MKMMIERLDLGMDPPYVAASAVRHPGKQNMYAHDGTPTNVCLAD